MSTLLIASFAATLLGGCAEQNAPNPIAATLPLSNAIQDTSSTFVYACGSQAGVCAWFPLHSNTIAGSISGQPESESLGVDSTGNVYIPQFAFGEVLVYPKGSSAPLAPLQDPGEDPVDVAVALDGTIFVANGHNSSFGKGSVSVYKDGVLKRIISDPNFQDVDSLAVDEHHLLIVCYNNGGLAACDEFPNARGSGVTVISGLRSPSGVKFDKNENIVVLDGAVPAMLVYPPAGGTPCNTIPLSDAPQFFAFDRPQKHFFIADNVDNAIVEETYPGCVGSASVVFNYNTGWTPNGVAVDLGPNP